MSLAPSCMARRRGRSGLREGPTLRDEKNPRALHRSHCPFQDGLEEGLRNARFVDLIRRSSSSTQAGARNGFGEPRDWGPKSTLSRPRPAAETTRPAFEPAKVPANCGLFVRDQKTPVRIGLHGGPGRIRTSNQTVMSAPMSRHAHFDFAEFLDGTVVLTNEMANDWRRSFPAIASTALRMCAGW